MKKGLIGCLVVGLLLLVVGGGLAYWFVLKPMWSAVSPGMDTVKELAKIGEATAELRNKTAFQPPADGTLTAAQVAMFVGVQQEMQSRLGSEMAALEDKGKAIEAKAREEGREVGATDGMALIGEMTGLVAKGKQVQVDALNRYGTSMSEYEWVRGQVYGALPYTAMDSVPPQMAGEVNATNIALVKPHQELLAKAMANSMIGL